MVPRTCFRPKIRNFLQKLIILLNMFLHRIKSSKFQATEILTGARSSFRLPSCCPRSPFHYCGFGQAKHALPEALLPKLTCTGNRSMPFPSRGGPFELGSFWINPRMNSMGKDDRRRWEEQRATVQGGTEQTDDGRRRQTPPSPFPYISTQTQFYGTVKTLPMTSVSFA